MASVKGIIDRIRRLPARERQIVIKHLEQMKTKPGIRVRTRAVARVRAARPYAALIELAGTAHGDYDDVSTDKYRHLAAAYAAAPDAK
jgi:hypothetical protein